MAVVQIFDQEIINILRELRTILYEEEAYYLKYKRSTVLEKITHCCSTIECLMLTIDDNDLKTFCYIFQKQLSVAILRACFTRKDAKDLRARATYLMASLCHKMITTLEKI